MYFFFFFSDLVACIQVRSIVRQLRSWLLSGYGFVWQLYEARVPSASAFRCFLECFLRCGPGPSLPVVPQAWQQLSCCCASCSLSGFPLLSLVRAWRAHCRNELVNLVLSRLFCGDWITYCMVEMLRSFYKLLPVFSKLVGFVSLGWARFTDGACCVSVPCACLFCSPWASPRRLSLWVSRLHCGYFIATMGNDSSFFCI